MTSQVRRSVWLLLVTALACLNVSCGGGGGSPNDCSGGKDVHAEISYPGAFDVYRLPVGTSISPLAAQTQGVPDACLSSRRFSIASGALPDGLRLDPSTGSVSGTPTAAGWFQWVVQLELTGFTGALSGGVSSRVAVPGQTSFTTWSKLSDLLPIDQGRLDAVGANLALTSSEAGGMLVQLSDDEGSTWRAVRTGVRPSPSEGFATSHDAVALYGAGGRNIGTNTLRNDVWKFDGSQWATQTAGAEFASRRDAVMASAGGFLYVIGGTGADGILNDVWRSVDDGHTWQQTSAGFATVPALPVCAFALGGNLLVVTTRASGNFVGAPSATEIWRSSNGVDWRGVPTPTNSPVRALNPAYGQCAVLADRAFIFGSEDVVSSADLTSWRFEPTFQFDASPAGGSATIGGRIYVVDGLGTSQRTLHRSEP